MLNKRGCGILLHPTSLPGPGGIGSLGTDARRFIDLLHQMGMSYWQVLPLTPPAYGNSPYSAFTAFGGNPLLIDLERIVGEGDLADASCSGRYPEDRVDFTAVAGTKMELLQQAGSAFLARKPSPRSLEFELFCNTTPWLHDFALFMALKQHFNGESWCRWPEEASCLTPETASPLFANTRSRNRRAEIPAMAVFPAMEGAAFLCQRAGYRRHWRYPDLCRPRFCRRLEPSRTSFSSMRKGIRRSWPASRPIISVLPVSCGAIRTMTGRLWRRTDIGGGSNAFQSMFELFDIVRVDHFRGFAAAWQLPAEAKTAEKGRWVKGPGKRLFDALETALGTLPIIAEDLGVITPEVLTLRDRYNFPGMKILQFAFEKEPINLPHYHVKNGVVYTGTHDNDTTAGGIDSFRRHSVPR